MWACGCAYVGAVRGVVWWCGGNVASYIAKGAAARWLIVPISGRVHLGWAVCGIGRGCAGLTVTREPGHYGIKS